MAGPLEGPIVLDSEHRSPDPSVCPFLRAVDLEGVIGAPVEAVDPRNRCIATGSADPQDAEQQRSACLTAAHVRCARYLSGVAVVPPAPETRRGRGSRQPDRVAVAAAEDAAGEDGTARQPATPRPARAPTFTPAVIAAALFLVAAASAAVAFVAVRGGLALPIASSEPSQVAIASPSPAATLEVTPAPSAEPTPGVTAEPTSTPAPAPEPTPEPTAAPPTPAATSDRYALLTPCPDEPDCYRYTIRTGDNLRSIANYFGVPYDTVLAMNPQITDPSTIQPGDVIELPPPTR